MDNKNNCNLKRKRKYDPEFKKSKDHKIHNGLCFHLEENEPYDIDYLDELASKSCFSSYWINKKDIINFIHRNNYNYRFVSNNQFMRLSDDKIEDGLKEEITIIKKRLSKLESIILKEEDM